MYYFVEYIKNREHNVKNKNKIIIINGSGGCGKSTFVELCQKNYPNVLNISSVDFVKEVATYCGWDGTKDDVNREFLSDLKDVLTKWNDVPLKKMLEIIDTNEDKVIFFHIREPYEISKFVDTVDAKTVQIKRKGIKRFNNHADLNVDFYSYDYTIYNDGSLEDLENEAVLFMKEVLNNV